MFTLFFTLFTFYFIFKSSLLINTNFTLFNNIKLKSTKKTRLIRYITGIFSDYKFSKIC